MAALASQRTSKHSRSPVRYRKTGHQCIEYARDFSQNFPYSPNANHDCKG